MALTAVSTRRRLFPPTREGRRPSIVAAAARSRPQQAGLIEALTPRSGEPQRSASHSEHALYWWIRIRRIGRSDGTRLECLLRDPDPPCDGRGYDTSTERGGTSAETDQAHWGRQPPIGVGNLPTPMLRFLPRCAERPGRSLPQCSVSYPNALNALAVPCPNTPDSGAPPLRPPTPTHRFLPQCTGRPADRVGA